MARDNGDQAFLICLTAVIIPPLPSVVRRCVPCIEKHGTVTDLWISLDMAGAVDNDGVTPVCESCAADSMADGKDWTAAVAPQQVADLASLGLLGFADQLTTHVNRTRRWPGTPGA